jgi:hypothetical protein
MPVVLDPALATSVWLSGDWEAPCGGGRSTFPRTAMPSLQYVASMPQQPHWADQRCQPLAGEGASANVVSVIFACGCAALVARSDLLPLRD